MDSIRPATAEDAASIARVHVESWKTTYRGIVPDEYLARLNVEERTPRWREILKSSDHLVVAERDGELAGFASGGPIRELIDGYDAELYAIYLLEKFQRAGIGSRLMREIARRLEQDGFRSMALWVIEGNAAVRFYETLGGVRVAAKERAIGGAVFTLAAYGWPNLKSIAAQ
ncbi:MAG TPA: GNAT family N-acetyltransferase [Bryobacteraceae bacterium]|nr:GNAT family N-acetyltransferase [Bryobacteraceae bacterium]